MQPISKVVVITVVGIAFSSCADPTTRATDPTAPQQEESHPLEDGRPTASQVSNPAEQSFAPHSSGEMWLVGPPDNGADWPFEIPSGGVMLAAASGYEYDIGEPADLVRRSAAVATATVTTVGEPEAPVREGEQPSDNSDQVEFVNDVVIPVRLRIDEVVVGGAVEPGADYVLEVSAWVVDGNLFEFAESRVPRPGERYLMFVTFNSLEDAPKASGQIRTTAAGDGRVPLAEAESAGMLDAGRWREELAADFDPDLAAELTTAGLLP